MNHTSVIPDGRQSVERALNHVAAVEAASAHLEDLYEIPKPDRPLHLVAKANHDIGIALKLAEVNALLAVAGELRRLAARAERPGVVMHR